MNIFFSYVLKIKFCIIVFIAEIALFSGILLLNNVAYEEVVYGICLLLFISFIAVIYGYYRFYKKYKFLKSIEKNIAVSIRSFPIPEDCVEEEYQYLMQELVYYFNGILNKNSNKFRDMEEYYTMWVHQIKTPIAAMKLLLQEKSGEFDVSYEQMQLFKIEQYAEMALQYMRLGSESTDFVIKKVNVHKIVKEIVHKYARMFIQKKIKLDFQEFDICVVSDEKWLGFVIGQILSNAIKYTHKGSVLVYVQYRTYTGNGIGQIQRPVLVIEDTGIGINSSDLPRICEKGYTGYNGHDDKLSTGIGLYMCNKILDQLSHSMEIESEEGKGTKVSILFRDSKGMPGN